MAITFTITCTHARTHARTGVCVCEREMGVTLCLSLPITHNAYGVPYNSSDVNYRFEMENLDNGSGKIMVYSVKEDLILY